MIDGIIFDKDGTLFDFRATWGAWTETLIAALAQDAGQSLRLQRVLGYDLTRHDFAPTSPVIAMTTPEIAALVQDALPHLTAQALNDLMNDLAKTAPQTPAVDLPQVLGALRSRGIRLGLATNDTEAPARIHLGRAGVLDLFDFVAGCDSGWGGKPAPGQLHAFEQALGLSPARCVMVGDSRHDLDAGRAAGMRCVAVLTGIATRADLSPHADAVLDTIAGLSDWIDALPA